jgi:hypothetical protein
MGGLNLDKTACKKISEGGDEVFDIIFRMYVM